MSGQTRINLWTGGNVTLLVIFLLTSGGVFHNLVLLTFAFWNMFAAFVLLPDDPKELGSHGGDA
jgi:hypothetical protein